MKTEKVFHTNVRRRCKHCGKINSYQVKNLVIDKAVVMQAIGSAEHLLAELRKQLTRKQLIDNEFK